MTQKLMASERCVGQGVHGVVRAGLFGAARDMVALKTFKFDKKQSITSR